jgi:hypothetical protein
MAREALVADGAHRAPAIDPFSTPTTQPPSTQPTIISTSTERLAGATN